MKRLKTLLLLFITSTLFLFFSCEKDDGPENTEKDQPLRFISEQYKSFNNITEDLVPKGIGPELLAFICDYLNIACDVEFIPCKAGCQDVMDANNTVLFSIALNASRKDIAFSKNTSADIVDRWQTVLNNQKQDGTYDAIHRKLFQQ